jgi:UDPglucose 6-dehydrogenase
MIQDVAMKLGNIDVDVVTEALADSTKRIISKRYMKAGMGDGGGCHPRDNIALKWLAKDLDLGYDLFGSLIHAREQQCKNWADYLTKLSTEYNLPIVIIGKSFKPEVYLEDGSSSILISQYCNCTFDDFSKPAIFLLAHYNKKYKFPKGSIIVDPWRQHKQNILNKHTL